MEIVKIFEKELEFLKGKFPNRDDKHLLNAIEDSITMYTHYKNIDVPNEFDFKQRNWIKRCAVCLIRNEKYLGLQSYSENGYSISVMDGMIAGDLINEIVPRVGVPK